MSRVFIIGATGGVGSRLAAQLIERGDRALGLHRSPEQAGSWGRTALNRSPVT